MIRILSRVHKLELGKLSTVYKINSYGNSLLSTNAVFNFSKLKKEKPQLKVPTVNISKLKEDLGGFLLY